MALLWHYNDTKGATKSDTEKWYYLRMNAKEFLLQYAEYDRKAEMCRNEYKAEAVIINGLIKNRKVLGMCIGKENYDAEMASIIQFAKSLNYRADEAIKKRDDILAMLKSIPELERDVLCARYVEQMKWEDIATRLCYSWNGIWNIHDRAIQMLQARINEKENPLQT